MTAWYAVEPGAWPGGGSIKFDFLVAPFAYCGMTDWPEPQKPFPPPQIGGKNGFDWAPVVMFALAFTLLFWVIFVVTIGSRDSYWRKVCVETKTENTWTLIGDVIMYLPQEQCVAWTERCFVGTEGKPCPAR